MDTDSETETDMDMDMDMETDSETGVRGSIPRLRVNKERKGRDESSP
jgi:hypothetical protein